MAHRPGETEPYYPVPRDENVALHDAYKALAARETPHTHFAGRLGDYRYYNMDQAVGRRSPCSTGCFEAHEPDPRSGWTFTA